MRKLVIAAAVSMSLATISVNSHALSLGEIEMYSALNQTLDAEINIVSFAPGELDGVTVSLASAEAFAAAGLQRSRIMSAMRFDVEKRPDGVPVVKITSNGPVVEPFLSFLIQVDSPQGSRLVREYTVLLDPPVFTAQQSELAVAAPAVIENSEPQDGVGISTQVVRESGVLDEGLTLDLTSELREEAPLVIFNEQRATDVADSAVVDLSDMIPAQEVFAEPENMIDTDAMADTGLVLNLDNSVLVGLPDDQLATDSGELLDLGAELIDPMEELPDDSEFVDIALDQFADDTNVIFDNELNGDFQDSTEDFINLDSLAESTVDTFGDDAIASLASDIDRATVIGESVDLTSIIPDDNFTANDISVATSEGAEVDLNDSVLQPEVSFETVSSTTVPVTRFTTDVTADLVLGEEIDISGIVAGEYSNSSESSQAVAVGSNTYLVRPNDTLWSIARTQKSSGVSTQQMVVAILQANQSAFVNGDMNRLRDGAQLQIPAEFAGVSNSDAMGIVRQQASTVAPSTSTQDTATAMQEPQQIAQTQESLIIVGVDESASGSGIASSDQLSGTSNLDRDLDAVNKKMMLAQEELTSESLQRDELSSRVVELEDSLANMKKLITLRESELGNLQSELGATVTESDEPAMEADEKAAQVEVSQAENEGVQVALQQQQDNITADASLAQDRIDAQADADKNLASAEAEARSVRLATEEDTLKSQLAQLQVEKAQLIETAQSDKLALVQQAEAEKAQLLAQAKAERERIQAKLEAEKVRITESAAAERAKIAEEARVEKEKLLADANAERARLAAESDAMRVKLEALEEEKNQLLAESEADKAQMVEAAEQAEQDQLRLQAEAKAEKQRFEEESTKVKDRLAALQAEASANLSDATDQSAGVASNVMDSTGEAGSNAADMAKDLTGEGAAAVGGLAAGGLLAMAPLQRALGERKNVLAAGGGLALLGLLGAWAMRRRKTPVGNSRDIPVDIDTTDDIGRPSRARFDSHADNFDEVEEPRSTMGRAAVAASAAAAATGVAVSRDAAADLPEQREPHQAKPVSLSDHPDNMSVESNVARQLTDNTLLDDTITEADVYLRYGLHGQAEDLLVTAIERAPDNQEYHLKLLENYQDQRNAEGFKTAASNFKGRFGSGGQWDRIAEMGRGIDPAESLYSRSGSMDPGTGAAVVTAGAAAAGIAAANARASDSTGNLDETMDAGAEFSVDDLAATGDLSGSQNSFRIDDDLDDISLDEVDLAALDDDGTLNLEEIAGDQMSGLDLESLDLTNPDGDSTLDNLTLDDADLNSLGDVTSNLRSGLESDLDFSDNYSSDSNEMETMLDLAKAYIDMGDSDSAANALRDIVSNGNAAQQKEATDLLKNLT